MSNMKDMTTGNPLKLILFFSIPLLLANICQQCYNLADTFIVGRYLGKAALAAVGGASGSLLFLVFGFFFGLGGGLTVITAQRFGAKDYDNVRRSIATSLVICTVITVPCLILFGAMARKTLVLMNTPADVLENATVYLRIMYFFGFCNIMQTMLNSIQRSLGDSKSPLYFLALSNFLNIGMNLYFVLVAGWGVAGVAWATVISQVIAVACYLFYMVKKNPMMRLKLSDWKFDRSFYLEHLRVGLPMAFQFGITSVGGVVLQRAVNGFGSDAVGGISAVAPLNSVTFMPLFSIGIALSTFVAQNYGARDLKRLREGTRQSLIITIVYTAATSLLMYFFASSLVEIFLDRTAENAAAIGYGVHFLRIQAIFYILLGFILVYRNALQGMGFPFYPFMAGVVEMFCRVFGALFLSVWFGFTGAALSHPLAWVGSTVLLAWDYWRKIKMLKRTGIPERVSK